MSQYLRSASYSTWHRGHSVSVTVFVCCLQHFPSLNIGLGSPAVQFSSLLCYTHSLYRHIGGIVPPTCLYSRSQGWKTLTEWALSSYSGSSLGEGRIRYHLLLIFASETNAVSLRTCVWIFIISLPVMCPTGDMRMFLLNQNMSSLFLATHVSRWQMTIFMTCFSISCRNIY